MSDILKLLNQEIGYFIRDISVDIAYFHEMPKVSLEENLYAYNGNGSFAKKYWLNWTQDIGAWIDATGTTVLVVVREGACDLDLTNALIIGLASTITGACLNLRNQVAIHANAVSLNGLSVAFVGTSGRGKSTLSTYCAQQGAGFVTDDVLVVDSHYQARIGNPRIKLFPKTAASLGLAASEPTCYKLFFEPERIGAKLHDCSVRLGVIYLLEKAETDRIYSEDLVPSQAVFDLLTHSYYAHQLVPKYPKLLEVYLKLANAVAIKRLYYPRRFEKLPLVYDFLFNEVAQFSIPLSARVAI